ncbi:MAG: hypothetical protein JST12_14585 [Armatimonadetes bacterium]|nr:hypothetical protein [Armatimonadota bacterium]
MAKDTVMTDGSMRTIYAGPICQISIDLNWLDQARAAMFDRLRGCRNIDEEQTQTEALGAA